MKELRTLASEHGPGIVVVMAGIEILRRVVEVLDPWAAVVVAFVVVLIGLLVWYWPALTRRPTSPVVRWLFGVIAARFEALLDRLPMQDVGEGKREFQDKVVRMLINCQYVAALCGLKTGLVRSSGEYYKLFYDHANEVAQHKELRVVRCFVNPNREQRNHADEHERPNVQPLRVIGRGDLEKLERQLPGLGKQLGERRFGFVIFAYKDHVEVITHQLKRRLFRFGGRAQVCEFWSNGDVRIADAFVQIFKDIGDCSEESRKDENSKPIAQFLQQLDLALSKMPLWDLARRVAISKLGLPSSAQTALGALGVRTLSDLATHTEAALVGLSGLDAASLELLKTKLGEYGLELH